MKFRVLLSFATYHASPPMVGNSRSIPISDQAFFDFSDLDSPRMYSIFSIIVYPSLLLRTVWYNLFSLRR